MQQAQNDEGHIHSKRHAKLTSCACKHTYTSARLSPAGLLTAVVKGQIKQFAKKEIKEFLKDTAVDLAMDSLKRLVLSSSSSVTVSSSRETTQLFKSVGGSVGAWDDYGARSLGYAAVPMSNSLTKLQSQSGGASKVDEAAWSTSGAYTQTPRLDSVSVESLAKDQSFVPNYR